MTREEAIAAIHEKCVHCKDGSPLRFRDDTGEWIHEHIRTNAETRTTSFSQVYCVATDLRLQHSEVIHG